MALVVNNGGFIVNGGGVAIAPTSTLYTIGQVALGGIIAYIYQPGDPGYDANVQKGLVVATTDQSSNGPVWGCFGTSLGASGTALGTGASNTATILANCATRPIAASVAAAHNGGGFNDWFLPSKDELNKIYLNKNSLGRSFDSTTYMSSSEQGIVYYWAQSLQDGTQLQQSRSVGGFIITAVRYF